MKTIRLCKKCGFILGTRPGLKEVDGVCLACVNEANKKNINFAERQEWLTKYIAENRTSQSYDCVVAVSGGKDSTAIVYRLMKNHGVKKPLLITVLDEFTSTRAGVHNRKNLGDFFGVDHIMYRCSPADFKKNTREDFEKELHPLKWIERRLYEIPCEIARAFGIRLVFFGENSAYEYGTSDELNIFHPTLSDDELKVIYTGAIYPYGNYDSLEIAQKCGFRDLNFYNEWQRNGISEIDGYTQIDSIGYLAHHWCKYVKFGFQRVSDMACRFVREGHLNRDQAVKLIDENDYKLDGAAKRDFCRTIDITEQYFDEIVDKHANRDLVFKDINGFWRRYPVES